MYTQNHVDKYEYTQKRTQANPYIQIRTQIHTLKTRIHTNTHTQTLTQSNPYTQERTQIITRTHKHAHAPMFTRALKYRLCGQPYNDQPPVSTTQIRFSR